MSETKLADKAASAREARIDKILQARSIRMSTADLRLRRAPSIISIWCASCRRRALPPFSPRITIMLA
jgi:hypothetical protein